MIDIPRIGVEEARHEVAAGEALLVCAYADAAKCNRIKLEGSIAVLDLEARLASIPKDREVIFYCA